MQSENLKINKKMIKYAVFLGFSIFFVTILSCLPAANVLRIIKAKSPHLFSQVEIYQVTGSIWHFAGKAYIVPATISLPPSMRLFDFDFNWHISPLFLGKLEGVVKIKNQKALSLDIPFSASKRSVSVQNSNGQLSLEWLSKLNAEFSLSAPGNIDVKSVSFLFDVDKNIFSLVEGDLFWGGGKVLLPAQAIKPEIQMPPLRGKFNILSDGGLVLTVTGQSDHDVFGLIKSIKEKRVRVGLTNRLLKLLGQEIEDAKLNQMFFEIEQRLLCC